MGSPAIGAHELRRSQSHPALLKVAAKVAQAKPMLLATYYRRALGVSALDIYFPVFMKPLDNIFLGENVSINAFVHMWANAPIIIGDNTMIAAHVQISTSTHDYAKPTMRDYRIDESIVIGSNVWIGSGAIILPGVTIGDNSVVGAGSVVTRDIPANSLAFGAPARVMRDLPTRAAGGM